MVKHTVGFWRTKNPDRCQNDAVLTENKSNSIQQKEGPCWRQSLSAPKTRLEVEESKLFRRNDIPDRFQ
jgi:hypothetical protein